MLKQDTPILAPICTACRKKLDSMERMEEPTEEEDLQSDSENEAIENDLDDPEWLPDNVQRSDEEKRAVSEKKESILILYNT